MVFTDCGDIEAPTNGSVSYSSGTTYTSEATFGCDTGFTLSSMTTRTCQADKIWSNDSPSCDIKGNGDCVVFIIIYNVAFCHYVSNVVMDVITFPENL